MKVIEENGKNYIQTLKSKNHEANSYKKTRL